VSTTGAQLAAREQQRQLTGHQPGADHADLGHRPGQRPVRRAGRPAGALLHEIERVQPGAQLVAEDQVGQRLVLGREPGVQIAAAGQRQQLQRPVRRRGGAVHLGVDQRPPAGQRLVPAGAAVDLGPVDGLHPGHHPGRPAQRLGQEIAASSTSASPPHRLLRLQRAVLVEVIHDHGHRAGRATRSGSSCRSGRRTNRGTPGHAAPTERDSVR
jgi:hypothetical protein